MKRYQVFISSTYRDLHEERQEVTRALLELDCIPAGMELFPASDEDSWTLIRKVIDESDYYVVISAGRYGSIHLDKQLGYTEMEYDYALSVSKPCLAFLHRDIGKIPGDKSESTEDMRQRLREFRLKMERKTVRHWETPSELGGVVSRSLVQTIKNRPSVGWSRGDSPASEQLRLENLRLREKIEDLENAARRSMNVDAPLGVFEYTQKVLEVVNKSRLEKIDWDKFVVVAIKLADFEGDIQKVRLHETLRAAKFSVEQIDAMEVALEFDGLVTKQGDFLRVTDQFSKLSKIVKFRRVLGDSDSNVKS